MTRYVDLYAPPTDTSPALTAYAITPSDSTNFATPFRSIYVGVGGNISLVGLDGQATVYVACPQGMILPARGVRINATGTTATSLVGMV